MPKDRLQWPHVHRCPRQASGTAASAERGVTLSNTAIDNAVTQVTAAGSLATQASSIAMQRENALNLLQAAEDAALVEAIGTDEDFQPEDLSESEGLFVVPGNIDLVLKTNAKKVDFDQLNLENISGEIIVRNNSVNLRKLNMESNIGSGNLTMVYMAPDRSRATAGFELEMNNIIVEELINLFPSMDSLVPMLRSFEGVVDCQMSATCELDSAANVVLPSLHAACYLNGENMVLMDGETFTEISKKLMFKNKERNLIDYISVDISVKDNVMDGVPVHGRDRPLQTGGGGMHNLDMTFDYHISVIKSPVAF